MNQQLEVARPDADAPLSSARRDGRPAVGGDYNLLPYPSMPLAHTQPAHLAALGTLFGGSPPAVEQARVLELGCAGGGNIIPLAARFPRASFTGVDLSSRHIDDGRARVAELGLTNVELLRADLTTLELAERQFDYVICHGVFSWVPKSTQDAILRLCRQTLAPNGMATISYNVLPGWHLRMAIRDLCLRYAGTEGTPLRRVARARAALEHIAATTDETEPYGLLLRTEARRLKQVPASYILGEFLAPDNAPCYVKDFIGRAEQADLDYLCEVDLSAAVPHTLEPEVRNRITAFTATNRPDLEQDIDFLTGRLFRRSVLMRRQPADHPRAGPRSSQLQALHIASPVRLDATRSNDDFSVFTDNRGRPISIREPAIRQAIEGLEQAYPGTLSLHDLTACAGYPPDSDIAARIREVIFAMVLAGRASVSAIPLMVGSADDERPSVGQLARIEAASGQPWLTSLSHVGVPVQPILRILLPHLDGTHDRSALRERLASALLSRIVQVPELPADQASPSPEQLAGVTGHYVDLSLQFLARHGLLEPHGP